MAQTLDRTLPVFDGVVASGSISQGYAVKIGSNGFIATMTDATDWIGVALADIASGSIGPVVVQGPTFKVKVNQICKAGQALSVHTDGTANTGSRAGLYGSVATQSMYDYVALQAGAAGDLVQSTWKLNQ